MKIIEKLMFKFRPNKDSKFPLLYWLWEGKYTFLFTPNHVTGKGETHIKDAIDLKRTMFFVIIALIPALLFGMWNVGHQYYSIVVDISNLNLEVDILDEFLFGLFKMLPLIIISYGVGLGIEFIFCAINRHSIQEGFLVSGLLIPMIMPIEVPLWILAVAVAFSVIIGKEIFGGTGMNILNPALTARAFLFFAYPTKMSGNKVWINTDIGINQKIVDGFTGATPLGNLAETVGKSVGDVSNQSILNLFSNEGIYSLKNSFLGLIPGSIGETSSLAILIGAIILIFTGIGSCRIMFSMIIGGLSIGFLFNLFAVNDFMTINPLHHIFLGGFLFGTVFMATDPVSAAQTNKGKIIYGFFAGFLSIAIRVFNPAYPEGVMLAILFMNIMAPTIDHFVVQANINKRLKRSKLVINK